MRRIRWVASCAAACTLAALAAVGPGATTAAEPPFLDSSGAEGMYCATDLGLVEMAGQVSMALVGDPAVVNDPTRQAGLSGVAPVGDFVELLGPLGSTRWIELAASLTVGDPAAMLASDEEGGVVQRLAPILGALPSARRQVGMFTPSQVADLYSEYGDELRAVGVTMVFAPVLDVGAGPAIGSRSYGDDADTVIEYAGAVIEGYRRAGITPVVKHFPGHGRATADSHDGPAITPPLDELRQLDLLPYQELLSDDVAVMVGHLDVPGLTDGVPASLSSAAIDGLLRGELGFDGLVVSDALGMGAVRQVATPEQAIVAFLRAGGDLALVDWADAEASVVGVVAAVERGTLDEFRLQHAVNRVLDVKGVLDERCLVPWAVHLHAASRGVLLARLA